MVDDDLPASERSRGICPIAAVELIVVDGEARALVENLDAQLIRAPASVYCIVHGREPEAEVARPVDRPRPFVLRFGPRDHQPVVARAVEVEIRSVELELRVPTRHPGSRLIRGHEAERRFAAKSRVCGIGSRRWEDPT